MAIAEVKSVAEKNTNIRNYLLRKNLGKYAMYDGMLQPAIGDIYDNKTKQLQSSTGEKGLLHFTHESDGKYAEDINWQYLNEAYDTANVINIKSQKMRNLYSANGFDYRRYVYDVYGHEDVAIRFVNGLLAHECIEKALKMHDVGIVENISPLESMAGAVKTNINNFSGTDTRLGLLTNQLHANALYYGAEFNTAREIANGAEITPSTINYAMRYVQDVSGVKLGKTKIITPLSVKWYGNNTENMNNLPFLYVRDENTGRMATDHSEEIDVIHDISDNIDNLNRDYLDEAIANMVYYSPQSKYDSYVEVDGSIDGVTKRRISLILNYDFDETESEVGYGYSLEGRAMGTIVHTIYDDKEPSQDNAPDITSLNSENNEFDSFKRIREDINCNGLLAKTNELFKANKIKTMHGRFYNSMKPDGSPDTEETLIDTAKNSKYGNSHGRNLVRRGGNSEKTNGFDNPYCRVWTYHHQYDKMSKLIRPFSEEDTEGMIEATKPYRSNYSKVTDNEAVTNGDKYLRDNTVLRRDTGLVNITPEVREGGTVDVKRLMFSLENLAWKDVPEKDANLSKEQRGPNGGRLMWFPPYGLNFTESVNAQYESNTFIGRGEPIYTYSNTERTGNLEFIMLIDYPSVINSLHNKDGNINTPDYQDGIENDDTDADILRFFAGCAPLKYKEKIVKENKEVNPEDNLQSQYAHERIYVFFPNNYSGNYNPQALAKYSASELRVLMNKGDKNAFAKAIEEELSSEQRIGLCTDDDFYKYLLYGKNISVNTDADSDITKADGTGILGYEIYNGMMGSGFTHTSESYGNTKVKSATTGVCGISYTTAVSGASLTDYDKNLCIRPCNVTEGHYFEPCTGQSSYDNSWNFYHRIDYDLHEKIHYSSNRDLAAYGLNCNLSNVNSLIPNCITGNEAEGEANGFKKATASFAELCCALKEANLLRDSNDSSKWEAYVKNNQGFGLNMENITRLNKLFQSPDAVTEIKLLGCATKQNSPTSNMLAIRRELALKGLMLPFIKQASKEDNNDKPKVTVDTNFITSSFVRKNDKLMGANSCLEAKIGKMACIDITYETNKINDEAKNIETDVDNKEEEAIQTLFSEMMGNSELLQNFNEKKPDCYDIFKKWFLDNANSDGGNEGDSIKRQVVREFISKNWKDNKWNNEGTEF